MSAGVRNALAVTSGPSYPAWPSPWIRRPVWSPITTAMIPSAPFAVAAAIWGARSAASSGGDTLVNRVPGALRRLVGVVVGVADLDLQLVGGAAGVLEPTGLVDRVGTRLHAARHLGVRRAGLGHLELADRHDRDRVAGRGLGRTRARPARE